LKKGEEFAMTLDGHTIVKLEAGQSLFVTRAPLPFIMVKSKARNYFWVLKQKLGLL
jgi:hypothetical protein